MNPVQPVSLPGVAEAQWLVHAQLEEDWWFDHKSYSPQDKVFLGKTRYPKVTLKCCSSYVWMGFTNEDWCYKTDTSVIHVDHSRNFNISRSSEDYLKGSAFLSMNFFPRVLAHSVMRTWVLIRHVYFDTGESESDLIFNALLCSRKISTSCNLTRYCIYFLLHGIIVWNETQFVLHFSARLHLVLLSVHCFKMVWNV